MYYVYVLKSLKDGQCYIGLTNDLKRRFDAHKTGKVISTKSRRPLCLMYYEAYYAKQDAVKRESMLKLKSRAYAQLRRRIGNSIAGVA